MIFNHVGGEIQSAIAAGSAGAIGASITWILTFIGAWFTIHYFMFGCAIIYGRVQEPIGDFMKSFMKFAIIFTLACGANGNYYQTYVGGTINSLKKEITSAWSGGKEMTPLEKIDGAARNGYYIGMETYLAINDTGWTNFNTRLKLFVCTIIIWVSTIILVLPAAVMIIMSEAMIAILIAIGPLFIVSLMFPVIQKWFDSWFSQVMTQIATIALLCLTVSIAIRIFNGFSLELLQELRKTEANGAKMYIEWFRIIKFILVTCVLTFLLQKMTSLASGLFGGIASSSISVGQFVAGAATGATLAAGAARAGLGAADTAARGIGAAVRGYGKAREEGSGRMMAGVKGVASTIPTAANHAYNRFLKRNDNKGDARSLSAKFWAHRRITMRYGRFAFAM